MSQPVKPRLSMVLGDPSGIGPELVAKLLADPAVLAAAEIYLIGSREELLRGQEIAGVEVPFIEAASIAHADFGADVPVLQHVDAPEGGFPHGEASAAAGRYCLTTLGIALDAAAAGEADAVCYAPLNKTALHAGGNRFADELHWFGDRLGAEGYLCEVSVLGTLWTSRVTSHVGLNEVSGLLTVERVLEAIELIDREMRLAGLAAPRITVCCLNPHCGEGEAFGSEEVEVIEPAVAAARRSGVQVDGPFPADTIFIKARDGLYDAVVTMYHDQGQIALKLMGFERGVGLQGGLPVPVTTPSHGTAFDIVGRNQANVTAMHSAFDLACEMGSRRPSAAARGSRVGAA